MAVVKSVIWRYSVAFVALAVIVVTWILMAEVVKSVSNPYFAAYIVHCVWSVAYPMWITWKVFPGNCKCNRAQDGKLSWRRALITSGFLNGMALLGALAWYLSLETTNVAANSAVYMSMTAFTFLLSVPILRERVTVLKVMSVVIQIGGVFMVAYAKDPCSSPPHWSPLDNATNATQNTSAFDSVLSKSGGGSSNPCDNNDTVLGYVFLLVSIFLYASFEVFYKKFVARPGDTAEVPNAFRMIGLAGIHCLAYCWPLVIIIHFAGIKSFEWPSLEELGLIFLTAFCDMLMNSALVVCLTVTSPLFAGVGQTLVLPASVVVDYFIRHYTLKWFAFIGIALIVAGFVGFNVSYLWQEKTESKGSHKHQGGDANAQKTGLETLEEDNSAINYSHESNSTVNSSNDEITELLPRKTKKPLKFRIKYLKYII